MKSKLFVFWLSVLGVLILFLWTNVSHSEMRSIRVDYPQPREEISSPLQIAGIAPHCWFTGSQFPVELRVIAVGSDLSENILPIASDSARVTEAFQSNWATGESTPFTATLYFMPPPSGTTGVVVLKNNGRCRDLDTQNEFDIPITF